jgi:hypothetical protein
MVPPVADQITAGVPVELSEYVPSAENCWVAPTTRPAEGGVTSILTRVTGTGFTVTAAVSANPSKLAMTEEVPAVDGAVYNPEAETLPVLADQFTVGDVFELSE